MTWSAHAAALGSGSPVSLRHSASHRSRSSRAHTVSATYSDTDGMVRAARACSSASTASVGRVIVTFLVRPLLVLSAIPRGYPRHTRVWQWFGGQGRVTRV